MKLMHHARPMAWLSVIVVSSLLSACGGGADESNSDTNGQWQIGRQDVTVSGSNPAICNSQTSEVNWDALLEANCHNLSDYNLFKNPADPTQDPQSPGIPYALNTQLFTDYATKYRFVFVPNGQTAQYSDHEVMDFPVGSVLVKTFAIPENTDDRLGNEHVMETRLLIHRESGWEAVPYYWSSEDNAQYLSYGASIPASTTHNGKELSFNYGVPTKNECTNCHAIVEKGEEGGSKFMPIGPKARYLNWHYDYGSGEIKNQLIKWEEANILIDVPNDKTSIEKAATFNDSTDIQDLTSGELDLAARSYLDINCAHCHRSDLTLPVPNYAGPAGYTGLLLEFNRDFNSNKFEFGICKEPIASGSDDHQFDTVPGYADKSFLVYRMDILGGKMMPELGRDTIHSEGVELVTAWINNMTKNDCGLDL